MSSALRVFAPASCGNVCVGYDILGLCYSNVGDTVTVEKISTPEVKIKKIHCDSELPLEASKNTAGIVLQELIKTQNLNFGFSIEIEKGIPLKSGMGGSAASAIGALVGANEFLSSKLSKEDLLKLSLKGEELSSGSPHGDNVAPCLYGGLVLMNQDQAPVQIPFPSSIQILLIHPHLEVETQKAREVLPKHFQINDFTKQSSHLALFLSACYENNIARLKTSFQDTLIEPYRASLTQGFQEAKELALKNGAIGYSLSGSGPSQIALCESESMAKKLQEKIEQYYQSLNLKTDTYIGPINTQGAQVL